MKLNDLVVVRMGMNLSRGTGKLETSVNPYTYDDMKNDINGLYLDSIELAQNDLSCNDTYIVNCGNIVFSFVSSSASIVSDINSGKILSQNFAKLLIDQKKIDSCYLCYCLNESKEMRKQMNISMQGSAIPKLTPAILKGLELTLPDIGMQRLIGKNYFRMKKKQNLMKEEIKLEKL